MHITTHPSLPDIYHWNTITSRHTPREVRGIVGLAALPDDAERGIVNSLTTSRDSTGVEAVVKLWRSSLGTAIDHTLAVPAKKLRAGERERVELACRLSWDWFSREYGTPSGLASAPIYPRRIFTSEFRGVLDSFARQSRDDQRSPMAKPKHNLGKIVPAEVSYPGSSRTFDMSPQQAVMLKRLGFIEPGQPNIDSFTLDSIIFGMKRSDADAAERAKPIVWQIIGQAIPMMLPQNYRNMWYKPDFRPFVYEKAFEPSCRRYDPLEGASFISYLSARVSGCAVDYLRETTKLRYGNTLRRYFRIQNEGDASTGYVPRSGFSPGSVVSMSGTDEDSPAIDGYIKDNRHNPEAYFGEAGEYADQLGRIRELVSLAMLNKREVEVLCSRDVLPMEIFGTPELANLQARHATRSPERSDSAVASKIMARRYGVTESRVSQIASEALNKLRNAYDQLH